MAEIEYNRIKLMQACLPALAGGEYRITAEQKVTVPKSETLPKTESRFYVNTPKFTLAPDQIYSVYPGPNSNGGYGNTLSHVVFSNKTYPWERCISPDGRRDMEKKDTTPWIALICLGDQETGKLKQMTIRELSEAKEKDIFCPKYQYEETTGEKAEDTCTVIDIAKDTFLSIAPEQEELKYLSHVRIVDLHDCADDVIPLDGYFSLVTANRFPVSAPGSGQKNTAFLVSLEGYDGCLPVDGQGSKLAGYRFVRLICLSHWDFFSVQDAYAGFRASLETMDSGPLSVKTDGVSAPENVKDILKKGCVPLRHITRTGEETVSLYRGPLTPYKVASKQHYECRTQDGEIQYDPKLGIFDMSYSAAWQLGRLLTLKNRAMAQEIFNWRRGIARDMNLYTSKMLVRGKMAGFADTLKNEAIPKTLADYWISFLADEITEEELIAPLADYTGLADRAGTDGIFSEEELHDSMKSLGVVKDSDRRCSDEDME